MAYSPEKHAANSEIIRYDLGWDAINSMLRAGRSLSGNERNCCFLNTRTGRFADVSGVAGLDFADDGRVLALSDWDYDGDVDFWVANRSGPQVRYLQNELGGGRTFLKLKLEGVESNRDAIGTRVVIRYKVEGEQQTQSQTLRAGEGYLAQNSKWLHFGLGQATRVDQVEVFWPLGRKQVLSDLPANNWYRIREGDGNVEIWESPKIKALRPSKFTAPPVSDKARIVLLNPIPLSLIRYETLSGETQPIYESTTGRAKLVNLWATWCQPCLDELNEWKHCSLELAAANVDVLALNADEDSPDRRNKVSDIWSALAVPFELGMANEQLVSEFDTLQRALLSRQRPLPLPSSLLIDGEGRLRVVYKGAVDAETLLADAKLVDAAPAEVLNAAIPFKGRWANPPGGSTPLHLMVKYIDNDLTDTARAYVESLLAQADRHPEYLSASMTNLYGAILLDAKEYDAAREAFEMSLTLDPTDRQAHIELGTLLLRVSRGADAEPHFEAVLEANPHDPELIYFLAMSQLQQRKLLDAKAALEKSITLRPSANAYWQLGNVAIGLRDAKLAIRSYEQAIELLPELATSANNLAWLLATLDDDSVRNGKRAVELAQVIASKRKGDPGALDTLAAAYAEAGDFDGAVATAMQAYELANRAGNDNLAKKVQARIESYREKQPHRAAL